MSRAPLIEAAQLDAVQELAVALIAAGGEVLTRHGPDPDAHHILAAGFALAIDRLAARVDPSLRPVVIALLGRKGGA